MILAAILTLSALISNTLAWGIVGHEIVATIAQIHLHPTAVKKLCDVLPSYASCHLAPIAGWADKIRGSYPWSSHMHYIGDIKDHPSQHCAFGENGWEDEEFNVLTAIRNSTQWLAEQRPGQEEALKFLVHFLGDMHMPLHLTGRDRGGNGMRVRFDGRTTNLHSVWDSRLIAKFVRTVSRNYTRSLPSPQIENALRDTIYDPYIREIMWEGVMGSWKDEVDSWLSCGEEISPLAIEQTWQTPFVPIKLTASAVGDLSCPYYWAKPIHKLNCDIVWPRKLDELQISKKYYLELDTKEYAGVIKRDRIIEKLLAMAGIRLASVLNGLYADV